MSRGGAVLHTFHLPAYRIRIAPDSIPSLADGERVVVFTVDDVTRYDWPVIIGFHQPFGSAEEQRFVELGGRVTTRWPGIKAFAGLLPDASLPELRSDPSVRYVETRQVICKDQ